MGRSEAAFPEGIDAASKGVRAGGRFKFIGEGAGKGHHFPEAIGLGSFDAAAPHFGVEKAGDSEELIANDLGVEAGAGTTGEEAVVGISGEVDRGSRG